MRDEETGTYWQQISGRAVSGPLAGAALKPVHSDELTLALWKSEEPRGTILRDVSAYTSEYSPKNWDVRMKRVPVVLTWAQAGIGDRDVMLGVHSGGAARAFPYDAVLKSKLIEDRVGADPVLLVLGPDGQSVRAFLRGLPNVAAVSDFYRTLDTYSLKLPANVVEIGMMMDSATGSKWNFEGCAIEGSEKGACLEPVEAIKDYWFDWRQYNPDTTVFGKQLQARSTR